MTSAVPDLLDPAVGFPSTVPAYILTLEIAPPLPVGSLSRGTPLTIVPITGGRIIPQLSTLTSPSALIPSLHGSFLPSGPSADYIHNDPTGTLMRLNTHAVLRDAQDNLIYMRYRGVIEITPAVAAILGGSREARTTEFGNQFISLEFETGSERYKELERGIWVGSGHFVVDEQRGRVSVEYRISRVVAGLDHGIRSIATQTDTATDKPSTLADSAAG